MIRLNNLKKVVLGASLALLTISCGGSKNPQISALKAKEDLLKLNTELTQLQIKKEKQAMEVAELMEEANSLNAKADSKTTDFSASSENAADVAKEAKKTANLLDKTRKVNKKLAKEQSKLDKINQDIEKIQSKLEKLNKEIEFVPNEN